MRIEGNTILTHAGRYVDPLALRPEDVTIEDIAHALSNQCRFSGHVSEFYSVAEHSVRVARRVDSLRNWTKTGFPEVALYALLHDASEAYLVDMPRPLKYNTEFGRLYREAEDRAMDAILAAFGVKPDDIDETDTKRADLVLLATEVRDLMPPWHEWACLDGIVELDDRIAPWSPAEARREFLAMFASLYSAAVDAGHVNVDAPLRPDALIVDRDFGDENDYRPTPSPEAVAAVEAGAPCFVSCSESCEACVDPTCQNGGDVVECGGVCAHFGTCVEATTVAVSDEVAEAAEAQAKDEDASGGGPHSRFFANDASPVSVFVEEVSEVIGVPVSVLGTKPTNPKDAIGSDKLPLHLWPKTATLYGSLAMLDGALKYGRSNWRESGVRASIYVDALDRHVGAWFEGEDLDPDSGVPHLSHALACLAILVDALATGNLVDDRQFPGGYRALVESMTPHVARLEEKHAARDPHHFTIADASEASVHAALKTANPTRYDAEIAR
jgi:5'-deoxynucleotidase YfbR-like HD superfamily hydrolase